MMDRPVLLGGRCQDRAGGALSIASQWGRAGHLALRSNGVWAIALGAVGTMVRWEVRSLRLPGISRPWICQSSFCRCGLFRSTCADVDIQLVATEKNGHIPRWAFQRLTCRPTTSDTVRTRARGSLSRQWCASGTQAGWRIAPQ